MCQSPKMKVFRLYVTINGSQAAHSNDSDIPDGLTAKTVWCMLLTNCKIFQLCPARAIMIAKTLLLKISGGGNSTINCKMSKSRIHEPVHLTVNGPCVVTSPIASLYFRMHVPVSPGFPLPSFVITTLRIAEFPIKSTAACIFGKMVPSSNSPAVI